jgi:hypothetical protein
MQALILTLRSLVVSVLGMTAPLTSAASLTDFESAPTTLVTKTGKPACRPSAEPLMIPTGASSKSSGAMQFYPSTREN